MSSFFSSISGAAQNYDDEIQSVLFCIPDEYVPVLSIKLKVFHHIEHKICA